MWLATDWPGEGWRSGCVCTDGLPRLLVLFVDLGVRTLGPAWSTSQDPQSSSPILGSNSWEPKRRFFVLALTYHLNIRFSTLSGFITEPFRHPFTSMLHPGISHFSYICALTTHILSPDFPPLHVRDPDVIKPCCPINTLMALPHKSSSDSVSYILFISSNLLSDNFGHSHCGNYMATK